MTFRREWQYGKLVFVFLMQRLNVVRHLLSLRLATFAKIMSTSKELARWRRGRAIVGVASTKERRWLKFEDSGQSRRRCFLCLGRVRVLLSTSQFPVGRKGQPRELLEGNCHLYEDALVLVLARAASGHAQPALEDPDSRDAGLSQGIRGWYRITISRTEVVRLNKRQLMMVDDV